jgi:hypothetical protein
LKIENQADRFDIIFLPRPPRFVKDKKHSGLAGPPGRGASGPQIKPAFLTPARPWLKGYGEMEKTLDKSGLLG